MSAFLSWRKHAAHGSAGYARAFQLLALEFDSSKLVVVTNLRR